MPGPLGHSDVVEGIEFGEFPEQAKVRPFDHAALDLGHMSVGDPSSFLDLSQREAEVPSGTEKDLSDVWLGGFGFDGNVGLHPVLAEDGHVPVRAC
jgi:hypothetical protein